MNAADRLHTQLEHGGISRRGFLKYCASLASVLGLPSDLAPVIAQTLGQTKRQSVIWLPFQECTGCAESLTRSPVPTIENLIFNFISLDYHHTLQAASGEAAEQARKNAMRSSRGKYLLVVDGSIPVADAGVYATIAGISSLDILKTCARDAAAIIAIGSCASFGGLPRADPNPTGADGVGDLMKTGHIPRRPLVNISGCPPLPTAISATLAHYLMFDRLPALDGLSRPQAFYANTIHERCSRLHFYEQKKFAKNFDDEGARQGWCLYELGCKGPLTHNACAAVKWNDGTSNPIESGHPCLGCSEPGFWDRGGFYQRLLHKEATADATNLDAAESGKAVFEHKCIYCHDSGAQPFRTPPDEIPGLFKQGASNVHHLNISEQELHNLLHYLARKK